MSEMPMDPKRKFRTACSTFRHRGFPQHNLRAHGFGPSVGVAGRRASQSIKGFIKPTIIVGGDGTAGQGAGPVDLDQVRRQAVVLGRLEGGVEERVLE
jgi:hypothetical protein